MIHGGHEHIIGHTETFPLIGLEGSGMTTTSNCTSRVAMAGITVEQI